ncbi:MAG: sugar transferase [Clostridia bacterium]
MGGEARLRNYLVILLDGAVVFLCFYIVLLLGSGDAFEKLIALRKIIYLPVASTVLIFIFTDMYKVIFKRYVEILFNCIIAGIAGIILFTIFVNVRAWHSGTVQISYLLVMLLLIGFLSGERILVEFLYRFFMKVKGITIIGSMDHCMKTGYEFIKNRRKTHEIRYVIDSEKGIGDIGKYLSNTDIVVVCAGVEKILQDRIVEICARYDKVVYLIPELYEINTMRPRLTQIDDTPYLYFDSTGLTSEEKVIKRIFDLIASIVLIVPAFPVILICAAIIKVESKGPVFFRQERVSSNGVFNIIKLRTMKDDAEKETGAVLSGEGDERTTRFGRFLRKTRLDEVPQILNVFMGDMSLIGPRPERPVFVEKYIEMLPDYDKRHSVKAGISGLAQIMGKYSTNAEDKLRYDLIYIRNYSIIMDIKIFFLTLKTVFLEPGSVLENKRIDYAAELKNYNIEIIG